MWNKKEKILNAITILIVIINSILLFISMSNNNSGYESSKITEMQLLAFNSKFVIYEGIKTGIQVNNLIDIVNKNNEDSLEYEDAMVSINGVEINRKYKKWI